ncbi:MAG: hypothetical protein CM15mP107_2620 [Bacteroidota bacterium]|nr:MAG: hypothetical protein CM15mP107_2620 [Bacteroidota bacterium]
MKGKSAIAEGLAFCSSPEFYSINHYHIDLASLVAGTNKRGQFEEQGGGCFKMGLKITLISFFFYENSYLLVQGRFWGI